jgi:hypothetical protein
MRCPSVKFSNAHTGFCAVFPTRQHTRNAHPSLHDVYILAPIPLPTLSDKASSRTNTTRFHRYQSQTIYTMPHTSASFDIALEDCNRKIDQSLRDLEDHTAEVRTEIIRLKATIRHLRDTIPCENEHMNRHHQVHVRHNNQVQLIKSIVLHTSFKLGNLRSHLRHKEEEILRAVNRVLGRLANEMPSWARSFSWMMQRHP